MMKTETKRYLELGLVRLSLRNLGRRKARTILTLLGIALGVAAMVAVGVVRESALRSVKDLFDQAAGRADLTVTNAVAGIVGGEGFDAAVLKQVQSVEGVEAAAPLLQVITLSTAQLSDWQFSFAFGNFDGTMIYGVDPDTSRDMGHYRLAAGDDLDTADDDAILLTESYAETLGVDVGDMVELIAPAGQARFTVIGLLASEGLGRLNRGQVGVTKLATAQRHFERPNRLDQVDVVVARGTDTDDLGARLETALGEGFRVFRPASKGALVDQLLQTVVTGMSFVGVLSLLVGGFLIYNTFATTVTERTRELGLLRALGTSRDQIVGLVLIEAALMGVLGASLGVLLGMGMASGLREMAAVLVYNELTTLVLLPQHVISGLVLGVAVTLVAALIPALQAGRLPVMETIQQRRREDGQISRWQVVAGLILAAPSLAVTIVYAIHPLDAPFGLFYLTPVALLVGVGLLIPAAIPPLERFAGAVLGLLGVEGRLGGRNLARNPGRAALTAGALTFGLASVIIIWAVMDGMANLSQEYLDKTLAADLWIYAPQPLPPTLTAEFESLPGVALVGGGRNLPTRLILPDPTQPQVTIVFTAFDPRRLERITLLFAPGGGTQEEARARLEAGGAVLIASPLREWYGFDVGDSVWLQTLEGPVDFEVAGVTQDVASNGFVVHGVWDDATRYLGTDQPSIFAVNLAEGADAEVIGQRILDKWGETYNLRIETNENFRTRVEYESERMTALFDNMVLVGVAVAALGVVNTLLMNVLERRREIGMLRSLGMTQGQVVWLILAEAAAMGGLGGVLGLGLGAWLSYFSVISSTSATGYHFPYTFPVQAIVVCAAIALVVPFLTGLWPAWWGARANVVEAMRGE